jgi:hypothetical protein
MDQNHSWEENSSSAYQKSPCILCNQKVCYRVHKSQSRVSVLSQINPSMTIRIISLKHFNIILLQMASFLQAFQ